MTATVVETRKARTRATALERATAGIVAAVLLLAAMAGGFVLALLLGALAVAGALAVVGTDLAKGLGRALGKAWA